VEEALKREVTTSNVHQSKSWRWVEEVLKRTR